MKVKNFAPGPSKIPKDILDEISQDVLDFRNLGQSVLELSHRGEFFDNILNESKKFGPLEIKILKCGKVENNNILDDVAYMQVKDLSKNENEKVFIFNGWTFASDPNLTPFDHAIYDLQLVNCKV